MKEKMIESLELFKSNIELLRKSFKLESEYMLGLGAVYFTTKGQAVDVEAIKKAKSIIDNKFKLLSVFRNSLRLPLSYVLIDKGFNEDLLDNVESIYNQIKVKWLADNYKAISAIIIAASGKTNYESIINKAISLYDGMKERHKYITASEDFAMATLLAIRGVEVNEALDEMEKNYSELRSLFKTSKLNNEYSAYNPCQTISHLLTLFSDDYRIKTKRVCNLVKALRENHKRIGAGIELTSLGLFANSKLDTFTIASTLIMGEEYLKLNVKGYKYSSKSTRLMYSAYLLSNILGNDSYELSQINTLALFIIQQQMILLAVCVTTIY